MSKTLQELQDVLGAATDAVIAANIVEQNTAALLMARAAREEYPEAISVLFDTSDQGDWLVVTGLMVRMASGTPEEIEWEPADQECDASSHLYGPSLDSVPGLTYLGRLSNPQVITLDIETVLVDLDD